MDDRLWIVDVGWRMMINTARDIIALSDVRRGCGSQELECDGTLEEVIEGSFFCMHDLEIKDGLWR
jgi:hypothetical protein